MVRGMSHSYPAMTVIRPWSSAIDVQVQVLAATGDRLAVAAQMAIANPMATGTVILRCPTVHPATVIATATTTGTLGNQATPVTTAQVLVTKLALRRMRQPQLLRVLRRFRRLRRLLLRLRLLPRPHLPSRQDQQGIVNLSVGKTFHIRALSSAQGNAIPIVKLNNNASQKTAALASRRTGVGITDGVGAHLATLLLPAQIRTAGDLAQSVMH